MVAYVLSPDFDIATVLCGGFVVSPHAMVVPQSVCLCECVCACALNLANDVESDKW